MLFPKLEFFSHECGVPLHDRMHNHPYWQLEYILDGKGISLSDETGKRHTAGSEIFILIPPLAEHAFERTGNGGEVYSYKFSLPPGENLETVPRLRIFRAVNFAGRIAQELRHLAGDPSSDAARLCAGLIGMLLDSLPASPKNETEPELLRELHSLVQSRRRELNVQTAAETLGFDVSQLKYRFRLIAEAHPERTAGTSVKRWIDRELMTLAERYLVYSRLSMTEIARELRFPDVYSFSRFVRRISERPPKSHRTGTILCKDRTRCTAAN